MTGFIVCELMGYDT